MSMFYMLDNRSKIVGRSLRPARVEKIDDIYNNEISLEIFSSGIFMIRASNARNSVIQKFIIQKM